MSRCPDCGKFCVLKKKDTVATVESPPRVIQLQAGLRYYYHCPRCKKDFKATICEHCGGPMPGEELS